MDRNFVFVFSLLVVGLIPMSFAQENQTDTEEELPQVIKDRIAELEGEDVEDTKDTPVEPDPEEQKAEEPEETQDQQEQQTQQETEPQEQEENLEPNLALTTFDLEDIDLYRQTDIISEGDTEICGTSELRNNIYLPFTMTVKYPQTVDVQVLASSAKPEDSELKKVQDVGFFTISSRNSTDVFTIKADWEYQTKPNEERIIAYEIFSDNIQVGKGHWFFDDFTECHIWSIETDQKPHIPTLEEFQEQNKNQLTDIVETLAIGLVDNNDLLYLLFLAFMGAVIFVAILVLIVIWFNQSISQRGEEAEMRMNETNNKANELLGAFRILIRSNETKNDQIRTSFLNTLSFGSTTIGNLIIDLRKILHDVINKSPETKEPYHLKSGALKPKKEINEYKKQIEESKPSTFAKFTKIMPKKAEPEKITEEYFVKKYSDERKYPNSKLEIKDSHLRKQYDKNPSEKLLMEINAISKIIKKRLGLK